MPTSDESRPVGGRWWSDHTQLHLLQIPPRAAGTNLPTWLGTASVQSKDNLQNKVGLVGLTLKYKPM